MTDPADQAPVSYDSWIQRLCPSPRRYLQHLVVNSGCKRGVDLGCGENSLLSGLFGLWRVGVDGSAAMIHSSAKRNLFDEYVSSEVLGWLKIEAARGTSYDVVIASHVIEHLNREDGTEFLRLAEKLAARLVYIETPYGFVEPGWEDDAFSHHRSGWFPWDFSARGYTVFGMGLRGLRGSRGRPRLRQEFLTRSVERALQRLSFRLLSRASTIAAIRYTDEQGTPRWV